MHTTVEGENLYFAPSTVASLTVEVPYSSRVCWRTRPGSTTQSLPTGSDVARAATRVWTSTSRPDAVMIAGERRNHDSRKARRRKPDRVCEIQI